LRLLALLLLLLLLAVQVAVAVLLLSHAVLPAAGPLQEQWFDSEHRSRWVKWVALSEVGLH
jgi:hypothetical protein